VWKLKFSTSKVDFYIFRNPFNPLYQLNHLINFFENFPKIFLNISENLKLFVCLIKTNTLLLYSVICLFFYYLDSLIFIQKILLYVFINLVLFYFIYFVWIFLLNKFVFWLFNFFSFLWNNLLFVILFVYVVNFFFYLNFYHHVDIFSIRKLGWFHRHRTSYTWFVSGKFAYGNEESIWLYVIKQSTYLIFYSRFIYFFTWFFYFLWKFFYWFHFFLIFLKKIPSSLDDILYNRSLSVASNQLDLEFDFVFNCF